MKESIKRVAVSAIGFLFVYSISDALLGWVFQSWMPLKAIWAATWFGIACFTVFVPAAKLWKPSPADEAEESDIPARPVTILEEPAVNAAVADIRAIRTPDIEACLADSGCVWYWANTSTIDRIYVHPADDVSKATEATLVLQGNRIPYIDLSASVDGMPSRFTNKVFVESVRAARAEKDAPISDFLATCVPDAEWTWKDVENGLICISSKAAGLKTVTGKLLAAKGDGHFYAVELFNHTRKRLVPKKSHAASVPAREKKAAPASVAVSAADVAESASSHVATAPAEPTEPAPIAKVDIPGTAVTANEGGHSACVSRGADYKETPIETNISPEEEIGDEGLLRPTEDPGLTPEQLTNHARLTWADNADTYTEYAMSAIENGEMSFVAKWPEGIQTLSEATALAQYIVKDGAYPKVDVIANDNIGSDGRGLLRVWLSESDLM